MEYVYAALLLHSAKKEVTEANVEAVLKGAGIEADKARAKALVSALSGVNIDEALKAAVVAPAAAAPAEAKKEEKKEEKKTEEEAAAGLASLFG